ncbi:alpha-mannosidase [Paenibacillus yonginensis]|uniref:alpha-mannosidase n=1 Tax=Paenibacillus yonginensis TaxID=1462996 RepID=A0A1B1N5K5_9BACL|nr:glycoside hydrolase family 38 C-terminal domain-containing protein [Paenibacillus yonginensis]ANS76720.1 alpha-mannosidase [Paenibacillus yonginensis]
MERIRRFIRELADRQWLEQQELRSWSITKSYYKLPGEYENFAPYPEGEGLDFFPSKQGTTYFFRTTLEVPAEWRKEPYGLVFASGGEGLLRVNGASFQGLDRNHTYVTLDPAKVGEAPELEIELFDPVPEPVDPLNRQAVIQPPITSVTSLLVRPNQAVRSLMYTATVVRDSLVLLSADDFRGVRLKEALYRAMDRFVNLDESAVREGAAVAEIEEKLKQEVQEIGGNAEGLEHMVGQSHIDIAWLWPVRETVRKTSRTFSTVDRLMDEYPEYRYSQSQPLLFAFLKENDPELFERVKKRIAEGRWELVGGMWVEPDLNLPSGESLIRQMLYGQRFYQQEFGQTSNIEWLPDTFGYCASLPQILKHGKVDYFMTTKLGWNDTNVFPYDLFHWVGIDGTPMLSYLNHGVNEHTTPKDIRDHWQSYREKAVHNEQMLLYGHGDGGGGVTREMLEYLDRSKLMVGQPASRYSTAKEFFEGISAANPELPAWHGDLYLELHRGTYTTHARNKRSNRKAEVLYREAELWNELARPAQQAAAREQALNSLHEGWKLILLNQFHDIIPGSAITESYETSDKEYVEVFEKGQAGLQEGLTALASGIDTSKQAEGTPYAVFNSFGWSRSAAVRVELAELEAATGASGYAVCDESGQPLVADRDEGGLTVYVPDVPAFGYKTFWVKAANPASAQTAAAGRAQTARPSELNDTWETDFYSVRFNGRGEIISLFDKQAGREIVKPGEAANRFHFFHDRPTLWDAWDIDTRYEKQRAGEAELLEKRLVLAGQTKDVLRFRWRIGNSEITQDVIFYHQNRRIDFKTHVSWNEAHKLLKVGFPVDVLTEKATYEIPFGSLERVTHRNTSWEQAQYEVCGHRFVDVSEFGYGVSLLNDCKYGYDVQGSTIRLSLLRAPKWPDVQADLGEHDFTYSLLPHEGDWRTSHIVRHAAELNLDMPVLQLEAGKAGSRPSAGSLIAFESTHVVLDTVKAAEDGNGTILRFYESSGGREQVSVQGPPASGSRKAYLSNALEEQVEELPTEDGKISLSFAPYEIKTVLLK